MPELLADINVLGADAELIVAALRELGVAGQSTVVDLGRGKGGVAIAIAASLGCQVIGIELFEPFIAIARRAAEAVGVERLCRFVHGGIGDLAETLPPADVVVYAALGDVLGPLDMTMALIRCYARPDGYVIVNDSYLRDGDAARFPGFEHYADLAETRGQTKLIRRPSRRCDRTNGRRVRSRPWTSAAQALPEARLGERQWRLRPPTRN